MAKKAKKAKKTAKAATKKVAKKTSKKRSSRIFDREIAPHVRGATPDAKRNLSQRISSILCCRLKLLPVLIGSEPDSWFLFDAFSSREPASASLENASISRRGKIKAGPLCRWRLHKGPVFRFRLGERLICCRAKNRCRMATTP